jgi:hypothetical protein
VFAVPKSTAMSRPMMLFAISTLVPLSHTHCNKRLGVDGG